MAERINSKTIISTEEALRIEIMVNQALVDILIAKQIVSEGELIAALRKITRQQEFFFEGANVTVS
ncbi:MAG: hypothetical protein AMJ60_05485 [Desulfobacterales bacterium SG8_35]|jgi:hypothetical protein|nr:MAG: hypothetical protein AMJ60_05485 [Desulfobacterales bacterium SG8_35]